MQSDQSGPTLDPKTRALYWAKIITRRFGLADKPRVQAWNEMLSERLKPLTPEVQAVLEIPRVKREDATPERIREALRTNMPTVFEGLMADSEAVQTWSHEFFRDTYPDVRVPLMMGGARDEELGSGNPTLAEIMNGVIEAERIHNEPVPPDGVHGDAYPMQVNNFSSLFAADPTLLRSTGIEQMAEWTGRKTHGGQLFMQFTGAFTPYHCANEVNFFFMIKGRKTWRFVHPKHTAWMEAVFSTKGVYADTDFEFGQHPVGVPVYEAVVLPGDVLLNPPWWWHQVVTDEAAIGVSTRWMSWAHRFVSPNSLFSLLQWTCPHQWSILYEDYIRGGLLTDEKWVETFEDPRTR